MEINKQIVKYFYHFLLHDLCWQPYLLLINPSSHVSITNRNIVDIFLMKQNPVSRLCIIIINNKTLNNRVLFKKFHWTVKSVVEWKWRGVKKAIKGNSNILRFAGMVSPFLFILILCITYTHSITFILYIHPSSFAEVPLHRWFAKWEKLRLGRYFWNRLRARRMLF